MSDLPLPGSLARLEATDPLLHAEITGDFRRLAHASAALVWAQDRLPALLAAAEPTAVLQLLVAEARALTGAPVVWALVHDGDRARPSIRALAGDGAEVPSPGDVSRSIVWEVVRTGRPTWSEDARADARFVAAESVTAYALRSVGCLPVGPRGLLYLADPGGAGRFGPEARLRLAALAQLAAPFLDRRPSVRRAPPEPIPGIVGRSPATLELVAQIRAFAAVPWAALILGASGTGKEATARALHDLSPRAKEPFVAVNCGAIPGDLAESTLFGHERGAFTGADRRHLGMVERVGGGTLFLDEVGELPPALQVKLLRLLQEGTYERVGGDRELRFAGRVVAATNRNLRGDAGRSGFREDLYYRLAACVLHVSELDARREDIPDLAAHLLARNLAQVPGVRLALSEGAVQLLVARSWPGNVRELDNALRTAIARALAEGARAIEPIHLLASATLDAPSDEGAVPASDLAGETERFQRRMVEAALARSGGNVSRAAARLGVSRQWLHRLLARWEGR